jgi:hypothetical protein
MDEFMLLAMLLAGINALPPLLFFVYLFTKGRVMRYTVYFGQIANTVLFVGACTIFFMQGVHREAMTHKCTCMVCNQSG